MHLREGYGRMPAFLYGWISFLIVDPGVLGSLATGTMPYLDAVLPCSMAAKKLIVCGAIAVLAAINILGLSRGAWFASILTALKIGALAFPAVYGIALGKGSLSHFVPFFSSPGGGNAGRIAGAFVLAFFSFGGWWDASKLAGEARNPEKTMPRALAIGVSIVTLLYVVVNYVLIYLVAPGKIASGEAFAVLAGEALFGRSGKVVFALVVLVSVTGSAFAMLMAAPRTYFAAARDGLFIPWVAKIDHRLGVPARAIALQACLGIACVQAFREFDRVLGFFIAPMLLFLTLAAASAYRGRDRRDWSASRIPGYPLTPLLFIVPVLLLIPMIVMQNPMESAVGLGATALACRPIC